MSRANLAVECVACGDRHMESSRPGVPLAACPSVASMVCPRCQFDEYYELTPEEVAAKPFPTPAPVQIGPLDV